MDDYDEFRKAIKKLPPPIRCFANGAACPWCGAMHETVTFGEMGCVECGKAFCFGYPDWHGDKEPISYVNFPWREWDALGQKADMLPDWKPNDRLKHHYHQKVEEYTGIEPDYSKPQ